MYSRVLQWPRMSLDEPGDDLQFDRADIDSESESELHCSQLGTPIDGEYFLINGAVCSPEAKESLTSYAESTGSGPSRLTKACLFGGVAAVLGSLLYFLVTWLTGYEIGLISIVVGVMVGKAVFIGSGSRGGVKYQVIAVLLTYLSIVSSFVPIIFMEISESADDVEVASVVEGSEGVPGAGDGTAESGGEPLALSPDSDDASDESLAVMDILMLIGLLLALPFLSGFENLLGLAIIAFGLWEAWKLNARAEFVIEGPYTAESGPID